MGLSALQTAEPTSSAAALFVFGSTYHLAKLHLECCRLVSADISLIARQLLEMRLSVGLQGLDLMSVVQAQPSLLVQETSSIDSQVKFPCTDNRQCSAI